MHPNIWHPFTIQKGAAEPLKVVSGKGLWLELESGHKIADCISSWWVNIHGHAHPDIVDAIHEQARTLEHVLFANYTHDPAEKVAEVLAEKLPGNLNRVFYSDNGSTAVEVALKMAVQYWQNKGEKKSRFIAFNGSYHGDTFGAMSAGSRSVFSDVFRDMLFNVDFVDFPETWEGDDEMGEKEDRAIEAIEQLLVENQDEYAAIIIEPLVQGAGGMRICSEEFLQKLHWVNRQFDTLLIFDEVMTGFGRTGSWFASERAQVEPDIICLAKGLTGGFLPLSVTVCADEVYQAFYSDDPVKTLWHGHSYTANPLGCAAAVASLKLLEKTSERFQSMEQKHRICLKPFSEMKSVEKIRVKGTIAAFDIKNEEKSGYLNSVAKIIKEKCIDKNLLLRPLGNTLYLMPPYCITDDELSWVYKQVEELVSELE
ncbi:MAG: adenosylmethionine--8-amino-7-oxononanoate transaminase [Balneolaceae bacterium]